MSWEDLGKVQEKGTKQAKEAKEAATTLAKNYAICFGTEQGKYVLQHLVNEFVMGSDTSFSSQNINYEAAYHNGESGAIKYILNQIKRAQIL